MRTLNIGLMKHGRINWQEAEISRKDSTFQWLVKTRSSWLPAFQGHSGHNPIDPSNVVIPDNFLEYIYHIGCAINSHSTTNSGLILGGQNLGSEGWTGFFLRLWILGINSTKIGTSLLWLNNVLHSTSRKRGKTPRYVVLEWYTACSTESIEVLSNKIERSHPLRHTPSSLYPENWCVEIMHENSNTGCCIELVLFFSNRYFWRKNAIVRAKRLSLEEFYKKCYDVVMWAFFLLSSWNWSKFLTGKKIGTFQAKMTKNGPKISEKNTICNDDFGQKCKNV